MSNSFRTKLSDLEFVEELSDVEVKAVAGGTGDLLDSLDDKVEDVLNNLFEKKEEGESKFKKKYPELAELIFDNDDDDHH